MHKKDYDDTIAVVLVLGSNLVVIKNELME
jgi:hypothetical protein